MRPSSIPYLSGHRAAGRTSAGRRPTPCSPTTSWSGRNHRSADVRPRGDQADHVGSAQMDAVQTSFRALPPSAHPAPPAADAVHCVFASSVNVEARMTNGFLSHRLSSLHTLTTRTSSATVDAPVCARQTVGSRSHSGTLVHVIAVGRVSLPLPRLCGPPRPSRRSSYGLSVHAPPVGFAVLGFCAFWRHGFCLSAPKAVSHTVRDVTTPSAQTVDADLRCPAGHSHSDDLDRFRLVRPSGAQPTRRSIRRARRVDCATVAGVPTSSGACKEPVRAPSRSRASRAASRRRPMRPTSS